ncbi:hypothetical protein LR48_Vigan10g276300 [Vigna angularis]|uniref:Transposase (putative) gypsy type domain-containing protein n=1 Tax=Phaseolus angularis TaxID=3914 RepID=A0A0L9VP76_PHAAN|nr:hypothetical protein LR48_Vigan10g276300 [Vigna angularis]
MDPCTVLDCTPGSGEERGQSSNVEAPGTSSTVSHREITTILSGESAFLYGNVVTENPENPSSSSPNMDVLKTLNVSPTQLHPNSWGYIQAFAAMCQALAIKLTPSLFLYFFRARPVAKRGWVSLISEPGNAILELYSQSFRGFKDKFFRVTIAELDKMIIEELDALNVLTVLPRPFSSRRIMNCLEHDDFGSRVFDIMGRKGLVHDWFKAMSDPKPSSARDGQKAAKGVVKEKTINHPQVERPPSPNVMVVEDRLFIRKRGVWDLAFNLGHKIAFNVDEPEKKVVKKMTEQEMVDTALEFTQLKEVVDAHLKCEQRQKQSEQLLNEARVLLGNVQKAGFELKKERNQLMADLERARKEVFNQKSVITALKAERDALLLTTAEDKELKEEIGEAIVLEHTRGFKKALRQVSHLLNVFTEGVDFDPRKDVYEGRLVPLSEIPEGALLESDPAGAEEEVVAETVVAEEIREEASIVPSTNAADVVID